MNGIRKLLASIIGLMMLCQFAFLLFQASAPEAQAAEVIVTRIAWMGNCTPPMLAVGRYYPGDADCHPSEAYTVEQMQTALKRRGLLLKESETLRLAPGPLARALTCWGLVMDGGQATGWVCSDSTGVYRTDMNGQAAGTHWQVLADGTWAEAQQ